MRKEPRVDEPLDEIEPDNSEKSGARKAPMRGRNELIARGVSIIALLATLYFVTQFVRAGYYALTDAFVAPLILTSDSDLVLPSKLNLARLQAERSALVSRVEQASALMIAAEAGDRKLVELRDAVREGLSWAETVTSSSVRYGSRDLSRLGEQQRLIHGRIAEQERYVTDVERQLASGLVRKTDLMRERDALNQLRVIALQKERETLESSTQLKISRRAARALRGDHGDQVMNTPELLQHREQLTHLEVDLLKLEAERHARASELRNARLELDKLDALIDEIRARPLFRAIESRQNVAFVPYTQIEEAELGAEVFECRLWGVFRCRKVGTVTQLIPGEVAAHDPWGNLARGQYALLRLTVGDAAKAKVLRVRATGAPEAVATTAASARAEQTRKP